MDEWVNDAAAAGFEDLLHQPLSASGLCPPSHPHSLLRHHKVPGILPGVKVLPLGLGSLWSRDPPCQPLPGVQTCWRTSARLSWEEEAGLTPWHHPKAEGLSLNGSGLCNGPEALTQGPEPGLQATLVGVLLPMGDPRIARVRNERSNT